MATNREVFDAMAPTWYGVRHWPLLQRELEALALRWQRGRVANLGCGTGADFLPFVRDFELVGLDFSRGMLRNALRYVAKHEVRAALIQGELRHLPFEDSSFDHAIGIACYHHLRGDVERQLALGELQRILRPGGEAFLSVWNHAQPRFESLPQDQFVPWQTAGVTLTRYYHLFTRDEFEALLRRCGFEILQLGFGTRRDISTEEDTRNICALVRRPGDSELPSMSFRSAEPD
jgi:tRNA (uracil-5-)-methyltransferase TRM9